CYRIHDSAVSTQKLATQRRNAKRAEVNMRRRRAGLPELSLEEFQDIERRKSRRERLVGSLRARSQYCYRRGGSMLAGRNPWGAAWLMGSLLLYPPLPLVRLRQQGVLHVIANQLLGQRRRGE